MTLPSTFLVPPNGPYPAAFGGGFGELLTTGRLQPSTTIHGFGKPTAVGGGGTPIWTQGWSTSSPVRGAGWLVRDGAGNAPLVGQWAEWKFPVYPSINPTVPGVLGFAINVFMGVNLGQSHVDVNGVRVISNWDHYFATYKFQSGFFISPPTGAVPLIPGELNTIRMTCAYQGNSAGNTAYPNAYYAPYVSHITIFQVQN